MHLPEAVSQFWGQEIFQRHGTTVFVFKFSGLCHGNRLDSNTSSASPLTYAQLGPFFLSLVMFSGGLQTLFRAQQTSQSKQIFFMKGPEVAAVSLSANIRRFP